MSKNGNRHLKDGNLTWLVAAASAALGMISVTAHAERALVVGVGALGARPLI